MESPGVYAFAALASIIVGFTTSIITSLYLERIREVRGLGLMPYNRSEADTNFRNPEHATGRQCRPVVSCILCVAFLPLALLGCVEVTAPEDAPSSEQTLSKEDSARLARQVMNDFDVDGDERLSADEFAFASIQMFESLDKNRDLKLDRDEIRNLWSEQTDEADSNSDGAVSLSELMRDQDHQFHRYDRDGDTHLVIEEITAFTADKLAPH